MSEKLPGGQARVCPQTIVNLTKENADGRVHWAGEHVNGNDGSENWCYACVHTAFTNSLCFWSQAIGY
ncbi:unnamed protein product [Adineta steineri]|uniref:Uncharacterized protein n=1 Tax=Adineta steineri TaxID=433720 RepID=A0A819MD85_9BILA|nr:unnamed protein product [Adineta steineri]CAF3954766.1 unnamed protein product [Adineta steineri]CAF3977709.1 unnamed protein product [Adineta steineri]